MVGGAGLLLVAHACVCFMLPFDISSDDRASAAGVGWRPATVAAPQRRPAPDAQRPSRPERLDTTCRFVNLV